MRNWADIRRRHYVRNASADNHWFDFMATKVRAYHSKFGNEFCLVVNGSDTKDDAYIIPFAQARAVFNDKSLSNDGRGRWVGTIRGSTLTLATGQSLDVARYHNAFQLLTGAEISAADDGPVVISTEVENAVETQLHLESDLQSALARNLEQLESGLKLFVASGISGQQVEAGAAGRIDILALDSRENVVVIELKAGEADRQVCGQIQAYMGWVQENLATGRSVRGIVVASDFTDRMKLAAKVMPNVALKAYSVVFQFRDA